MSLADKLDARRATAKDRFAAEDRAVMQRATEDLRNSGILERVLRIGDEAPDWTLAGARGDSILSRELLAHGPLVLTFFRGVW